MQGGGPATCHPGTRVRDGRGIAGGAGFPAHGSKGGPVDQIVEGIGQSLAHAGPEWAMIALMAVLTVWKVLPLAERVAERAHEREVRRERRKDRESAARDEFERRSAELQGRWLTQYEHATDVQKQTNAVMAGVQAEMATLNATLAESRDRSREMAGEVHEMHQHLVAGRAGTAR